MDLNFILKYIGDLPLKYHRLKAIFIVELSKTAQSNVARLPAEDASKTPESNKKPIKDYSVSVNQMIKLKEKRLFHFWPAGKKKSCRNGGN
jgi:hypothetical protein